jgi:cytochrome P450
MDTMVKGRALTPAHVQQHLVREFDMYEGPVRGQSHYPDIHREWKAFQDANPPIFWSPLNGGHWAIMTYDLVQEAALNPQIFSNRDIFIPQGTSPFLAPSNVDGPLHLQFRRVLNPFFGPKPLKRATDEARALTIELIDRIKPKGGCEFMKEFASIMPVIAFMSLIDLPRADLDHLLSIAGKFSPSNPEHPKAWSDLSTYVAGQIAIRREEPGDDFLSHMLASTVDGRPLTDEEMFSMALLVIAGGLDTVAISIGFATAFLAQNPGHRQELIGNPELLDAAIDEFLRRFGISSIGRVVSKDTVFHGVPMCAGESVLLMFPLAGLDPTKNDDPLTVDFNRKGRKHLIFGTGPHTCIGNRLGRREIKLFLEEWLQRIPDFELAPGAEPKVTAGVVNNLEELHLVWAT